jgi:hypothetical protein
VSHNWWPVCRARRSDRFTRAVLPHLAGNWSRTCRSANCLEQTATRKRRSRGCKEEFGHALVPLSLPRLRRLVPLSIGLSSAPAR